MTTHSKPTQSAVATEGLTSGGTKADRRRPYRRPHLVRLGTLTAHTRTGGGFTGDSPVTVGSP